jgi:hypothetical protein
VEAVKGSQIDCCGYPLSGLPREPPGVRVPLQLHHRRLGQHSPVHSSSVVGDPWRPDSHLPTPAPPSPFQTERSLGWCALWAPPFTRAVAPPPRPRARAGSRAGQRSARPGAPPPAVPQRRGRMVQSTTTPPVPRAVRRCGPPQSSAQGARPRASCSRGAAGSMSMTGRRRVQSEHSPGGLSVRLPWPPCRGLEHQASPNPPHPPPPPDAPPPQAARARWWRTLVHTRRPHEQPGRHYKRRHGRTKPQRGKPETLERHRRQRAGPGAAQPCDPSCPASATSMHAPPSCPARATHTGTAASPSRVCHHGVRGRSTVRQALGPDNRDSPSPVVSAQRRVLTMGQGVRHRP